MILIVDFGSQYTQLIAKRIRACKVFCEIKQSNITYNEVKILTPSGIILSGGPKNFSYNKCQKFEYKIFDMNIPVLGICYGMHFIVDFFNGIVKKATKKEYGLSSFKIKSQSIIFENISKKINVWMSHGDSVISLPSNFEIDGYTENTKIAAISDNKRKFYGIQFHPEVTHTFNGVEIIKNFIFKVCHSKKNWFLMSFIDKSIEKIRNTVDGDNVVLALSGGVDSSVTALLLEKAIGNKLFCIFVDNGFMRKNEVKKVINNMKKNLNSKIIFINSKDKFIKALEGIVDPEKKRKIIGKMFIDIFNEEANKIKNVKYLAQGTLYSDIIESHSVFGSCTSTIKSHHNVGGLPHDMKLKLIEPLKFLFKNEVRTIASEMGLDDNIIWRQPFPGPGLAIRIIGEVTKKKLYIVQHADEILEEEIKRFGYDRKLWQYFSVLLPIKTVGVMGDARTYDNIIALRAVTSEDAMTADWAKLPNKLLTSISNRIINEVEKVNRVLYDISSKPPSTIEFE